MSVVASYDVEAEEELKKQISAVVPRELLPNSTYAPVKGIVDIGWKAWQELPAADFLKELRKLDDRLIKEEEEWALGLAPMVEKGEFSLEQLKVTFVTLFSIVDQFATILARHGVANARNREVRDLILRHASEEVGHAELLADFCVDALGLDRARDVWMYKKNFGPSSEPEKYGSSLSEFEKSDPELAYAVIPFVERVFPRTNDITARALRQTYKFPEKHLAFFDLHRLVDIYHERYGLYVLGKYATRREAQENIIELLKTYRASYAQENRSRYDLIIKVR